jgi:hypothetical protein
MDLAKEGDEDNPLHAFAEFVVRLQETLLLPCESALTRRLVAASGTVPPASGSPSTSHEFDRPETCMDVLATTAVAIAAAATADTAAQPISDVEDYDEESSDDEREVENVHDKEYTPGGDQRCNISLSRTSRRPPAPRTQTLPAVSTSGTSTVAASTVIDLTEDSDGEDVGASNPAFARPKRKRDLPTGSAASGGGGGPSALSPTVLTPSVLAHVRLQEEPQAAIAAGRSLTGGAAAPTAALTDYLVDRGKTFTEAGVIEDDILHTDDDEPAAVYERAAV